MKNKTAAKNRRPAFRFTEGTGAEEKTLTFNMTLEMNEENYRTLRIMHEKAPDLFRRETEKLTETWLKDIRENTDLHPEPLEIISSPVFEEGFRVRCCLDEDQHFSAVFRYRKV